MSNQNICNICGANYEYRNGRWKCPACGAYKAEELSNEEVTLFYNAAQKLRLCDFDEAEKAYTDIIEKFPKNANGYWGRLLSRYGIKYEEDFDGRKIPTCYAASIESVLSDKDYRKALELADADTKAYFEQQAQYIERVRKEWIERAKKEKPYDIFICYKDSDLANGIDRTQDSIAAQDLYIHLTEQGYRVFFSRESLRDKVGEKYEPYIFNALSTAKVMLVYGTSSEYITSTWLKNEWTRYEKRLQAGEKKPNSLIVACDGFSPAELPKALSSMQCFDATKRSFYSDLDAVVKRIIKVEEKPKPVASPEKKKSKKAPIAIALASVMVAVLLCILIPNIIQGQKTTQIYNSVYDIAVSSDSKLFNKNAKLEVSELYNGDQYDLIVSAVESKIQKQLINIRILDISCSFEIAEKITVTMPVDEGINPDNFAVYYVSNTGNIVEECNSKISAGYVDFETTHFSYYVIAEIVVTDDTNNTGNPSDKVTISFDANGGKGNVSSITVERNDYFDMPANGFTRAGYTFVGWSSTVAGVEWEYPESAKCKATTSTTYYARWAADNGDYTTPPLTLKAGVLQVGVCADYEPYEYIEGGVFKGIEIDIIKAIAEELDLTVEFKNMAFEDLCSSLLQDDTDCVIGVTETAARNETLEPSVAMFSDLDLEYIIYTKKGFNELQSALNTTISRLKSSGKITKIIESYEEEAVEQTATIKFNTNGGSGSMPSQIVTVGEQSTLNNCSFTYNGYTFSGWATSASGNVVYTDGATFTADSVSEITLYAIWVPNRNSLIFNANGGSGSMESISIETNETITLPSNAFSRSGYTFIGWSDVANGAVKYNNAQSFKMTSFETVTLYAVWEPINYSITYDLQGGTISGNKTSYNVTTSTFTLPTPTKTGYSFLGWSGTDISGIQMTVTVSKGSTGNRSYTANWEVTATPEKLKYSVGLSYQENGDGTYSVAGMGECTDTDIVIPSEYNGKTIVGILEKAFYENKSITSIVIPNNIETIGDLAFAYCNNLSTTYIGSGVSQMGLGAFYVSGVKDVYIYDLKKWCSIDFGSSFYSNPLYTASRLFVNDVNTRIVSIPEGTIRINEYAFASFNGLTGIIIPSSVSYIDDGAFYACRNLSSIEVSSGNIVYHSNGNCLIETNTKTIIQGSCESIIPTDGSVVNIDSTAFASLNFTNGTITIPNCIVSVGYGAFANCKVLIYCQFSSVPNTWNDEWNPDNCTVVFRP